jgi:hypothetical protein
VRRWSDADLDDLVGQATVDAHDEDEQITGFFSVIEDSLEVPFETVVLGVPVTVEEVELTDAGHIVAVCQRDGVRQTIGLLDLPLPTPPPEGAEWIAAYRRWAG